ncbi:transcription factor PAP1-domain-containing protein [Bisporella sp. PMI_857]|nr:transcription factor PAP1-domain-containing protein [Bisporella sp. PMI_857]
MDTATVNPATQHSRVTLSARQEELLTAALLSNKAPNKSSTINTSQSQPSNTFTMSPSALSESPLQAPGSGPVNGFEESPFIDYSYDFEDSFDYDFSHDGSMTEPLPGAPSSGEGGDAELHDKRAHPGDEEDEEESGGGKRRESEGKGAKKPGRKPLTSEPTSKRKAQNRQAQRAFRERKERHLKDLETKVEDLQKASEAANHENSILRAQVEKMSMELREYRKRVSLNGNPQSSPHGSVIVPPYLAGKGLSSTGLNNPSDVNFQFEFPKFGRAVFGETPSTTINTSNAIKSNSSSSIQQTPSPSDRSQISPTKKTPQQLPATIASSTGMSRTPAQANGGDLSSLNGLFSPSLLESVSKSPTFDFFNGSSGSRSSTDSNGQLSNGNNTSYSSPSASSNSNHGTTSSCGTSPEPTSQSPAYNKGTETTLTTIGEESNGSLDTPFDVTGIDWFAQQNGNQFDPQLFGDYREPQDNILSGDAFSNDFFTDAFTLQDFNSPFNIVPSPAVPKKDLMTQIDENMEQDEVVPGEDTSQLLTCNTIWDRLQACPKVKEGEFDLDLLCKDLQKKAKCSETGAVVNEDDFNNIMKSYIKGANGGK